MWFVLLLPIMLVATGILQYFHGVSWNGELVAGIISFFFEAFTEEFFFRGILFVFLLQKTNLKIAYPTSLTSFTLMHPQNLTTILIIGTLLQGFLTIEDSTKVTKYRWSLAAAWQ